MLKEAPAVKGDEIRRKRNRDSQRHFRERRNRHLKELEERIATFSKSESERNARLITENNELRSSLSRARAHSLSLKSVVGELLKAVNEGSDAPCPPPRTRERDNAPYEDYDTASVSDANWPSTEFQEFPSLEENDKSLDPEALLSEQVLEQAPLEASHDNWPVLGMDNLLSHMQDEKEKLVTRSDQPMPLDLGSSPTTNALFMDFFGSHTSFLAAAPHHLTPKTSAGLFGDSVLQITFEPQDSQLLQTLFLLLNQEFITKAHEPMSRQIDGMLTLMEDYLKLTGGINNEKIVRRVSLASMMIFAKYASPMPAAMWFCSTCYTLVERLISWKLKRAFQAFQPLPYNYEQSELSLSTPHPSVIDWFAYGGLRDQIIKHFNDSTKIDQLFIEIMEHAVVEVPDISQILTSAEAGPGYLGVWNLFNAMTGGATRASIQAVCTANSLELHDISLPGLYQMHLMTSPDTSAIGCHTSHGKGFGTPVPLSTLLRSPELSRRLYHYLEVYDSHKCWKYDPAFYLKYPQLRWDGYEATLASGRGFRVSSGWIMSSHAATPYPNAGFNTT